MTALVAALFSNAQAQIPALADSYPGMTLGAAVGPQQLSSPLLAKHFNGLVAENAMKPESIHPTENTWNFGPADAIADYARAHHMALRGHTFVWYRSTPDWFFKDGGAPASADLVLKRLRNHIEVMMRRYGDVVRDWDVVNEVVDPTQADCYRHDKWYQLFGPDYIHHAFGIARAVDPKARLFINDYLTYQPAKLECLRQVIGEQRASGTPIDGIGHQTHMSIYYPKPADMDRALGVFEQMGLVNQITEMDMSLYAYPETTLRDTPESLQKIQGERYRQMMTVFLKHSIKSLTFWGIADDHTWLTTPGQPDYPLLFDASGEPKPAFWAIQQLGR